MPCLYFFTLNQEHMFVRGRDIMILNYENIKSRLAVGFIIIERPLPPTVKGLYADGVIAINQELTDIEKACTLLEEIGHHRLTYGDILDQTIIDNQRQERRARDWAASNAITAEEILELKRDASIECNYHAAERLCVTEEMLKDAYYYYRRKEIL